MVAQELRGRRVFIRRDQESDGFDGVVTRAAGDSWIYIEVSDPDPNGYEGIWINLALQREVGVLK